MAISKFFTPTHYQVILGLVQSWEFSLYEEVILSDPFIPA